MGLYNDFRDCENATVVIKSLGVATQNPDTLEMEYASPVTAYNNVGIYYELSANEKLARQQIQKSATGQVILDPCNLTTALSETMDLYITTTELSNSKFRMVTIKNPLNKDEAIIIDIVEN